MTFIRPRLISIVCFTTFLSSFIASPLQQSAHFTITRSVLDAGGGTATSANFFLDDSIAQPSAIGFSSSANFRLNAGYRQAEKLLRIVNMGVAPGAPPAGFNPGLGELTSLSYVLCSGNARAVTVTVGDRILLHNQPQRGGLHTVQWNGADGLGQVVPPGTYIFQVSTIGYQGEQTNRQANVAVTADIPAISSVFDVPDPFLPATDGTTAINYTTHAPLGVNTLDLTIAVQAATGLPVTGIAVNNQPPGSYSLDWDGTDAPGFAGGGAPVRDGLYIYRINAITSSEPRGRANEKTGTIVLVRENTESEISRDEAGNPICDLDGNPDVKLLYDPDSFSDIRITPATAAQLTNALRAIVTAEPDLLVQSIIFNITRTRLPAFDTPAVLIFQYDPEISGQIADKLQIRYFDTSSGQWLALDRQFTDTVNNRIIAEIDELSLFAVFTGEDTTPPVVTITSPQPVEYFNTSTIDIVYQAQDPVIDEVSSGVIRETVLLNGQEYGHGSIAPYYLLGDNILTVKAYDRAGNVGTASVRFTVVLEALVELKPEALKINPGILTAFVKFPQGYDVARIIDAACDGAACERMMLNDDETEMIMKFRRADIEEALEEIGEAIDTHFIVRGTCRDEIGTYIFEGTDMISKILEGSVPGNIR